MDGPTLVDIVERELVARHIKKAEFYAATKISSATFSQWRNNIYFPSAANIKTIEEYLGISISYSVADKDAKKERPTAILRDGDDEPSLFEICAVTTDRAHAQRIYRSLYKRSPEVGPFLRRAFLTCLPDKEMAIYRFIVKFYREGAPLLSRLSDDTYLPLLKAVRQLSGEGEQFRGFTRFSVFDGVLGAEIEPKNRVLPVLRRHFCERYHNETFFLYDRPHSEALLYSGGESRIEPHNQFAMAQPDEVEAGYRRLWRRFYDTVAIEARKNEKLRMTHMP